MRFQSLLKLSAVCLATFCVAVCPVRVVANDSASVDALTVELRIMAKDFAAIIDKKDGGAVAIGEFSGSTDVRSSVGPRIQLVLATELKALKVSIDPENYRFEIKGDYQPVIDKESRLLGIKLVGRLINRATADVLAEKPTERFIFGAQTVGEFIGGNPHLRPNADPMEISKEFERVLKDPRADVQGTKVRTQAGSPYAVEMLVKSGAGYVARGIDEQKDPKRRPLVPINKDEVYGVRLINKSAHEAAVDLRIDGINCFTFSDVKAQYWIVAPGEHVDVLGWHKTNTKTLEFKVVDFPDTAAAKLNFKPSPSIGLITACFSASWANDAARPADEPELTGRGTGFGAEITVKTEQVSRTIGQVRDTISVRYER
jgi:hypothetical protein